jgi:hypothetical protein
MRLPRGLTLSAKMRAKIMALSLGWHLHQLRFLDLLITGDVGPVELGYNYFPLEKLQVVERNIAIYEVRFDDEALYLALGVNEICFHVCDVMLVNVRTH